MKSYLTSKTIWINLLSLGVNLVELADMLMPAMEYFLTVEQLTAYNGAVMVLNIFIRFLTDKGVYIKKPEIKAGLDK